MNKSDYMIKFDTTIFSILLAYSVKSVVKSMTYKCVVTEWEWTINIVKSMNYNIIECK